MYTIMTVIDKQVIGLYADAEWRDVIDFATEVDEFEEEWVDHNFIEQVRDTGEAVRRHHDGVGTVVRVAFRNPIALDKH
jgi:hypothetical protein